MIVIHYDFSDGSEISFKEGLEKQNNFNTCCLYFFSFDIDVDDVVVIKKDGSKLSRNKLLDNDGTYTNKEIRKEHNIRKMLISNSFNFK